MFQPESLLEPALPLASAIQSNSIDFEIPGLLLFRLDWIFESSEQIARSSRLMTSEPEPLS
jgi:hypothetical protein